MRCPSALIALSLLLVECALSCFATQSGGTPNTSKRASDRWRRRSVVAVGGGDRWRRLSSTICKAAVCRLVHNLPARQRDHNRQHTRSGERETSGVGDISERRLQPVTQTRGVDPTSGCETVTVQCTVRRQAIVGMQSPLLLAGHIGERRRHFALVAECEPFLSFLLIVAAAATCRASIKALRPTGPRPAASRERSRATATRSFSSPITASQVCRGDRIFVAKQSFLLRQTIDVNRRRLLR